FPNGVTAPTSPGSSPFNVSFPNTGNFTISLSVWDSAGNTDPTPASVTVSVGSPGVNQAPNGSISHDDGSGSPGTLGDLDIVTGTRVVYSGSAIDPEGDPINFTWTLDGTQPTTAGGSGPISVRYNTPGTFSVRLSVSDNQGNTDPSPAIINVRVNPGFQYLPLMHDEDGNPNNTTARYSLSVDDNVNVSVMTPTATWTTSMMRYNNLHLPPVIKARRGTSLTFNVRNNLNEATTVHWHGFKIPAAQDGGPDMPINARASRNYNYTLVQPAAPLWFHPHVHESTATQVYKGLAGALIVTDDISDNLEATGAIPSGDEDIAFILQDRSFGPDDGTGNRPLVYQAGMMGQVLGMLGNRILVNGVEFPTLNVSTRQYRFRIFNGSNARTYDVALSNNAFFKVIATDGGLLATPVDTNHVMLSAGERAEIVVDFRSLQPGDDVVLRSRSFPAAGMMGGSLPNGTAFDIMRYKINTTSSDPVVLYTQLPNNAEIRQRLTLADATASRSFEMTINMTMMSMQFLINNKVFDINRVDELVANGATEVWSITNSSMMAHPFHAHAIQWQVLDRNLVPASGIDLGWKDTVLVQANETVRIIGRFDPVVNRGKYMYHCHILEHEDAGMMGVFEVQ
ncbi:MAG: multicopper oxidase domain-containing protein, partial [Gammaproteobacteria bacterium]|nr:multicopper oxidase domain-containing protein [Gammaproteobacteria bacterium]